MQCFSGPAVLGTSRAAYGNSPETLWYQESNLQAGSPALYCLPVPQEDSYLSFVFVCICIYLLYSFPEPPDEAQETLWDAQDLT